jgi:carbonic anhydrase/acetyltransferase-like protein (isoleucine patch superfamily)
VEYWLERLVTLGAREVYILATDRPEQVRALVGKGARWGLRVQVFPEARELTPAEALAKYAESDHENWLPAPDNARTMDHLPGLPEAPLFTSYAGWFDAVTKWLPQAATADRIGVREIKPGVWVGLHTRIAPDAELRAPCWLGENVRISSGAVVGPLAILENDTFVEFGTEISHSVIGPETFVGKFTEIRHSLARGSLLTSWKLDSCTRVPDSFLLSSLGRNRSGTVPVGLFSRVIALLVMLLTSPLALMAILGAKFRGQPALRPRIAVRPRPVAAASIPGERLIYYELASQHSWLRRWPQLWKIVRGNFCWIGNRPLSPRQATSLVSEFERLWVTAPLGLISLADVEGCTDFFSDETRAHASYYAAQAGRRLNWMIFARALFLLALGVPWSQVREQLGQILAPGQLEEGRAH